MKVWLEISGVQDRLEGVIRKLPSAQVEGPGLIVRSPLNAAATLNEHLLYFWSSLKHERKYLKNLQQDGAGLTFRVKGVKGEVCIEANGAEMLHLLNARLLIAREG